MINKNQKHAYLIMAHSNFYVLRTLLKLIDDSRNDIYLHINVKAGKIDFSQFYSVVNNAKLKILDTRLDTRWGDISLVKLEILLFEEAYKNPVYSYYHLLSGQDLPIKNQDYIFNFFSSVNNKQLVGFKEDRLFNTDRVTKIHLLTKYYKVSNPVLRKFFDILRSNFVKIQKLISYNYVDGINLKKGPQWVSITGEFVEYLLGHKQSIIKTYKWSSCPDEVFLQTLLFNSRFNQNIYKYEADQLVACCRYVNWGNTINAASPNDININDIDLVYNSKSLFARKFSDNNKDAVDLIYSKLKK